MAIILGLLGVFYLVVGLLTLATILLFKKKNILSKSEILTFFYVAFGVTFVDFFLSNHLAMFTGDSSVMTAIGYSAVPFLQISMALIFYSIIQYINKRDNTEKKYTPYLLGNCLSAACAYGITAGLAPFYWELLGKSIYG